jgi:hypothetical protein
MTGRFPRHGEGMPRRSASSPDSPLEPQFPAPRRTAESVPTPPRFTGPRRSAISPESPDHTTVFKKITEPVARRSAVSPGTPSQDPSEWRKVPSKDKTDPSKDEIDAQTPRNHIPPIPRFVKVMGAVAIVVLLVVAIWVGISLSGLGKPNAEASPSWALKLPSQIANFAHDEVKESVAPSGGGTVLQSNYSDGSSKFALLLQRPAPELETYLSDSGITGVTSVHDASCGTFEQAQKPVCARVIDKTVIMVMGFSDQDNETLANLIESVYNVVKNQ